MIDRYLLRYFLTVIEEGNFSRAAARCNVSQPTLSAGIAKLERIVEHPLFNRTNRRVELTPAGATFAGHARRIEAEFAAAAEAMRATGERPLLRLGVLTTIPDQRIAAVVAALARDHPAIRIELVEGRERDLTERLARGRIDLAFTIIRGGAGRFACEPLLDESYSLALPHVHPLASAPEIEAGALASSRMILRRACELLAETSRHFISRGVRPFFAARTINDGRALALVGAGLGVTVMPDSYRAPDVARVRLADFHFTRTLGLLSVEAAGSTGPDLAESRTALAAAILRNFQDGWQQ